jgi:hypothetical protein
MCVYICKYVCIYMCIYMYIYVYICVYICMYVYMYIYIHTCIWFCLVFDKVIMARSCTIFIELKKPTWNRAYHFTRLWARWIQPTPLNCTLLSSTLILSLHSSFSGLSTTLQQGFLIFPQRANLSRPPHPSWFNPLTMRRPFYYVSVHDRFTA